ncbi:DUF3169 family protein [uncultured Dysosmobacter sp.]|uniref:DUF3169 family protein n=1 Tax=uncultured Dysosmobacter sp. TaxID=2591384 RepID=UPI0026226BC9|nr:DUF3169 family protein [uncultured Dysosmobacter sp.]
MNDNVKKENRRALPRFLLILAGAAVFGGVLGFCAGWMGSSSVSEFVTETVDYLLSAVIPWLIPAVSVVLLAAAVFRYRKARSLFNTWDGEDEAHIDRAETCLDQVLLLGAVAVVLNFFLLSASPYSTAPGGALAIAAAVILALVVIMVIQQKTVDLTRRINPEKKGSVYDTKFQKKWFESCDEAEKAQIGQASYRAYRVTGTACIVLWVALLILDFTFGIGVLPVFVVLLLWGIMQVSYILECIRSSKREK